MFRPYNLTSIAAWTVGSLAGNEAYYRTKGGSRRLASKSVSYSPSPSVLRINRKLEAICSEINSLTDRFHSSANETKGKINLTPLIHLIAYYEWFQTINESLKTETRKACQESMTGVRDLISNEIRSAENAIDSISNHLNFLIKGIRDAIFNNIPDLKEQERQLIFDAMKERQMTCKVNDSSCKLVDSVSGRLFIKGRNQAGQ